MNKKLIDCFLFYNEENLLVSRIKYLQKYIDYFCIVESEYSFTGNRKKFTARKIIEKHFGAQFLIERIHILENYEYVTEQGFQSIEEKYANSQLIIELRNQFKVIKYDKYVWLNDCFQRELLAFAIRDCIKDKKLTTDSITIIVSDVDEIPSQSYAIEQIEDKSCIVYAEMIQYRYNLSIIDEEKWIGSVKFNYDLLDSLSVNELRFAPKRAFSVIKDYEIQRNAGWHFTSFGKIDDIKLKMKSWGHQELNTFINRTFLPFRLKYGLDIFGRNISYSISCKNFLPDELKKHLNFYHDKTVLKPNFFHNLIHKGIRVIDRMVYALIK